MFAPGVKERRKPPGTSLEKSRRRRPRQPAATSLLNDIRSPTRRLAGANAHRLLSCESELRVRSCGFPPDLRVSGARQRILRPSTPVETSRPHVTSSLYGRSCPIEARPSAPTILFGRCTRRAYPASCASQRHASAMPGSQAFFRSDSAIGSSFATPSPTLYMNPRFEQLRA